MQWNLMLISFVPERLKFLVGLDEFVAHEEERHDVK